MIGLFFASVIAGFVLSAPFGPVGALVADAALLHDRRRLDITVTSAVLGNGILAFVVSLGASPIRAMLEKYDGFFFLASGAVVVVLGIALGVGAARQRGAPDTIPAASEGIHPVSIFLITLLHPGSISAFLFLTAFFVMKIPSFAGHKALFATGVTVGSFFAFGPVGLVFWKMRAKADRFLTYLRYGLASVIVIAGMYLVIKGLTTVIMA